MPKCEPKQSLIDSWSNLFYSRLAKLTTEFPLSCPKLTLADIDLESRTIANLCKL